MIKYPCMGCEDRKPKCHATCEAYLTAKKEKAAESKNRRKDIEIKEYSRDVKKRIERKR